MDVLLRTTTGLSSVLHVLPLVHQHTKINTKINSPYLSIFHSPSLSLYFSLFLSDSFSLHLFFSRLHSLSTLIFSFSHYHTHILSHLVSFSLSSCLSLTVSLCPVSLSLSVSLCLSLCPVSLSVLPLSLSVYFCLSLSHNLPDLLHLTAPHLTRFFCIFLYFFQQLRMQ